MSKSRIFLFAAIVLPLVGGVWLSTRPVWEPSSSSHPGSPVIARVAAPVPTAPQSSQPTRPEVVSAPTPVPPRAAPTIGQEYYAATDIKAWFDRYSADWRHAPPEAKYFMAKALSRCLHYIGKAVSKNPRIAKFSAADKERPNYEARREIFEREEQRCKGFETYTLPLGLTQEELINEAAGQGFPAARMQLLRDEAANTPGEAGLRAAANNVMSERIDQEVISGLMNFMAKRAADLRMGDPPVKPDTREYLDAWRLVACDFGMDCGARSFVIDNMCFYDNRCGATSFDDLLRQQVYSPARYEQVAALRQQIFEGLQRRDLSMLGLPTKGKP